MMREMIVSGSNLDLAKEEINDDSDPAGGTISDATCTSEDGDGERAAVASDPGRFIQAAGGRRQSTGR